MKTQSIRMKLFAMVIAVGMLIAIWTFANASRTNAITRPEPATLLPRDCGSCGHHSGMFAIASFQSVRINVVNVGNPDTIPVDLEMKFYDAMGVQLAQSRVTLTPGQSGSLELSHRQLGRPGRVPIRAEVVGLNAQPDPPVWAATLEVYDNLTGRTMLFIADSDFLAHSR